MVNYQKAKLYKITSSVSPYYYVGSTCTSLHQRLFTHQEIATKHPKKVYQKYFNTLGWHTTKAELIENCPCESKSELSKKVSDYLNNTIKDDKHCINLHDTLFDLNDHIKQYDEGKIYKVICSESDYFYIGSTCTTLRNRLKEHKKTAKKEPNRPFYSYFNNVGWDTAEIKLLENYPCSNRNELLKKENEYISKFIKEENCLNSQHSYTGLTQQAYKQKWYKENKDDILDDRKQYYEDNKEEILERVKKYTDNHKEEKKEYLSEYYTKNKAKLTAKHKERFECECGSTYSYKNKQQHMRSTKHQNFLSAK